MEMSKFPEFCKEKGIQIAKIAGPLPGSEDFPESDGWLMELRYKGRIYSKIPFYTGYGHRKKIKMSHTAFPDKEIPVTPSVESVLHCLLIDSECAQMLFEDWASDFGYELDSRKALDTYLKCQKICKELRKLLREDFDAFLEASRDY